MDQHDEYSEPAEHVDEIKDAAENMTETKDLNVVQRVIGVFVSPGETFAQVDRKPDWLVPLILLIRRFYPPFPDTFLGGRPDTFAGGY